MQGARRTVTYTVEVTNREKFIAAAMKNRQDLLRFITIDEQELRAVARAYGDPERMEKEIPFVKVREQVNFGGKV